MPMKYVPPERAVGGLLNTVMFWIFGSDLNVVQEITLAPSQMTDEFLGSELVEWQSQFPQTARRRYVGHWKICSCKALQGHFASCPIAQYKKENNPTEKES